jgi:hypothetical protein
MVSSILNQWYSQTVFRINLRYRERLTGLPRALSFIIKFIIISLEIKNNKIHFWKIFAFFVLHIFVHNRLQFNFQSNRQNLNLAFMNVCKYVSDF